MASNVQLTHNDKSDVILKIGETLYLSEEMADFHFVFEIADDLYERIPAHKLLLVTASDVFRTMFNGSWDEKDEVEIVDASIDEFKEFLQFFYLGQVNISTENLPKVMYLGDKYNITKCLNICEKFIINTLEEDNVIWAYELAIVYNQVNLMKYCETFIEINTKTVLASDNFLGCHQKVLGHILKLNSLSCSVKELFEACMNWVRATAKVNKLTREVVQAQLGEVFYDIGFKSMKYPEFAALVPVYGDIFSAEEYKEILQTVGCSDNFEPKIFSKNVRIPYGLNPLKFNEKNSIYCNRLLSKFGSEQPYFLQSVETTKFSTNTPLFLKAIECAKIFKHRLMAYLDVKELPTEIKIVQVTDSPYSGKEIVVHNEKINLQSVLTCITLPKPFLVRPGFMYEIRLKLSPPSNYCTGIMLKSEVKMESNIIVQFHEDSILEGDFISRGTIRQLIFHRIF